MAGISGLSNRALGITFVIVGAVVAAAVIAALLPTYLGSVADVSGTFTDENTTTGNEQADPLLPIFGLLVAFGGLFAIVGLALAAFMLRSRD